MINSRQSARAHVVIVDDEFTSRKLLSSFLKRDAYKVYEAATGQELLDNINEWRPDVILLDVLMPGMDGFTVCRKLRASSKWRHISIIMITALNRHEDMIKGLQVGADEFLTKPVSGMELSARVQSMVRIKRQYDELKAAIQFRDSLVGILVHDMRNYMSVAILKGQRILRRANLESTDRRAVESVIEQIRHLDTFATDLSLITQLQTRQIRPDRAFIDFASFVTEHVQAHRPAAEAKGQTIHVTITSTSHQTLVDRHLMERLLNGLLANMIRYSSSDCAIELHVGDTEIQRPQAKRVPGKRLTLSNCAPMTSEPRPEKMLDSALSLPNALSDRPARFSFELVLANAIVKAHGGYIWTEDNAPHGEILYLEWPNEEIG